MPRGSPSLVAGALSAVTAAGRGAGASTRGRTGRSAPASPPPSPRATRRSLAGRASDRYCTSRSTTSQAETKHPTTRTENPRMHLTQTRIRAGLLGLPIVAAVAIAGCGGASSAMPTAKTPVASATTTVKPAAKHHAQHHHPRAHQALPRPTHSAAPGNPTSSTPPARAPATSTTTPTASNPSPPAPPVTKPAPAPTPAPAAGGIPQHGGGDRDGDNNGGPSDGDGNV